MLDYLLIRLDANVCIRLAEDTRERALNLLFRLTLDVSLTSNFLVCSELERTIVTMLESAPDDTADDMV